MEKIKIITLRERADRLKADGFDPLREYPSTDGDDILSSKMHQWSLGKLINLYLKMQTLGVADESKYDDVAKAFLVFQEAGTCPTNWKKCLDDCKIGELTYQYILPPVHQKKEQ